MWVPAYFRDLYMGGLLKTKSSSESENNFFSYFVNKFLTLVELQMRFQSAMDVQRYMMQTLDSKCKLYSAPLKTRIPLEKHACSVYTDVVFKDFQEQILSARDECGFEKNFVRDGKDVYRVVHFNTGIIIEVAYDAQKLYVDCFCKLFKRVGVLCKHALWVLQAKDVKYIPEPYILKRWTKDASKTPVYDIDGTLLDGNNAMESRKGVLEDVWNENRGVEKTKRQELEKFLGCEAPTTITIKNPRQSSNKGKRKEKDPKQKDTEDEEEQRVTKQRQSFAECKLTSD
ncbi:protein FAR1-RELATED SEQUENCE 9-like [Amaranthus tricolor]|uniref:protein FAR1-RELATED SEQUENCE 9-like n=1 Tax=Amaranthus tricolor TaxID=29722 RepID=UPI0025870423|nr:protein FAR1-RELATED SEQUENCE 9-like [Amaranthus tricolor]